MRRDMTRIDIKETVNKLKQVSGFKRINYLTTAGREIQRRNLIALCVRFGVCPVYVGELDDND
jgi:hypothetical protein